MIDLERSRELESNAALESSAQAARRALKAGNLQQAFDIYTQLVTVDPRQSRLFFERGMVAQLAGAGALAERDFRTCLAFEPGHFRAREQLGQIVRRALPFVGPAASAPEPPRSDGRAQFIYALGSSYIRSFGSSTLFVPLWLGTAQDLSFISAARAARTRDHLFAAIDRCDLRNPVLLVMSNNDPIVHADNSAGTKDLQANGELGTSHEIVTAAALRFVDVIEQILARYAGITLYVQGAFVMLSAEQNEYVHVMNRVLAAHCERLGLLFIDMNESLTDQATGALRPEFSSHPGDPHLNKSTTIELVRAFLARRGVLPANSLPFEWSFLWQAPLAPNFQVRIWGEPHTGPSNLVHSRTVAFNHVVERAIHVLFGTLALHQGAAPSVLVPYCREGLVPLALPLNAVSQTTGIDEEPARIDMAQRLAAYFGRPDITFRVRADKLALHAQVAPHDYVFVALRDEAINDVQAFLTDLLLVCRRCVVVLSTLDWSGLDPAAAGDRLIFPITDATTQPPWTAGTVLIAQQTHP